MDLHSSVASCCGSYDFGGVVGGGVCGVVVVVVGLAVAGAVEVVPVAGALVCAPPPTEPFAASCCWTACSSAGEVVCAVHPLLEPPPAPIDSTLIDTPQTFAATEIGICALIGMFALSMCRSSARLLRTFERLTFTSDGTLLTSSAPALATLCAVFDVLQAGREPRARRTESAAILRMTQPLLLGC